MPAPPRSTDDTTLVQADFLWTGRVTLNLRVPTHWSDDDIKRACINTVLPTVEFDHEQGELRVLSMGRNVPPPKGTPVEVLNDDCLQPRHDMDLHALGDG